MKFISAICEAFEKNALLCRLSGMVIDKVQKYILLVFILGVAFVGRSEGVVENVTIKQLDPWGLVEVSYDLTVDVSSYAHTGTLIRFSDQYNTKSFTAKTFLRSFTYGKGRHTIIWDARADGLEGRYGDFRCEVRVDAWQKWPEYLVVDLANGTNGQFYGVSGLDESPGGSWSDEYKTNKLVLRYIRPGDFMMGGECATLISKPFYIGIFEVTQAQYELVTGENPSYYPGAKRPIENVSWETLRGSSQIYDWPTNDQVAFESFIGKLRSKTGILFDLPTEAEWEFACRAGTTTEYYWGDKLDGDYAWCDVNAVEAGPKPVGEKLPNAWGLYDMSGNVNEWCLDYYGELGSGGAYQGRDTRIVRGGCWRDDVELSARSESPPSYSTVWGAPSYINNIGVRLAITLRSFDVVMPDFSKMLTTGSATSDVVRISGNNQFSEVREGTQLEIHFDGKIVPDIFDNVTLVNNGQVVATAEDSSPVLWLATCGIHNFKILCDDKVMRTGAIHVWDKAMSFKSLEQPIAELFPSSFGEIEKVTIQDGVTNVEATAFARCSNIVDVVLGGGLFQKSEPKLAVKLIGETSWVVDGKGAQGELIYRSNAIGHSSSTTLEFVTPAGMEQLVFSWKVGSERNYDWLTWYLDDVQKDRISGEGDWLGVTNVIDGAEHRVKFAYSKDGTASTNPDCGWVSIQTAMSAVTVAEIFPDSYESIRTVEVGESATMISDSFFSGCVSLKEVTLPATVMSISANAFQRCGLLRRVNIPSLSDWLGIRFANGEANPLHAGAALFVGGEEVSELAIPEGVAEIGDYAFQGGQFKSVAIPASVTNVAETAFAGCTNITAVSVPSWIRIENAFSGVKDGIVDVEVIPSGDSLPSDAFAGLPSLQTVTLPNEIVSLGAGIFDGCQNLREVRVSQLDGWGEILFGNRIVPEQVQIVVDGTPITYVYDSEGFLIVGGWLLDYQFKEAVALTIPEGVVGVGYKSLCDMYDLETVSLPISLRYIGAGAFQDDSYLDHVVIPDSVETIGDAAFCDCSYLQTIAFGSGLKSIGVEAFKGCTQLQRVVLLDGLATVGADAFNGDWRMQSVSLPTSVLSVASSAFSGCTSLTGVTVPTMCGTMAEWFDPIKSQIREATVPVGTTEVVSNMFVGCSGLRKVVLPESVTNIGDYAFLNCSSLKEVTICGAGLVRVGTGAFKGCSSIGELILPESVVSLGDEAFRGCSSLRAFVLPENVSRLGAGVFRECSGLKDVTLSRGLTELPAYTFYGCSQLDSFYVSAFVTNMGARVCSSATHSIYYLGNAPSCAADVFASASSVVNYVILGTKGWDGRQHSRDIPQSWQGRGILTWTANQFDVTYDAGEGVFIPVQTNTYACEQITYTGYKLPPYNPRRKGYWFDGWWTEENGGTEIRTTTRVVLTKSHQLYAHWKPIPEDQLITVHFNATGGTVVPDEQKYAASEPYCELPVPTREHFTFIGWSTETVGGIRQTIYSSAPKADRELFAQWVPNVYTIRFHSNNGNDVTADQQYVYGTSVTLRSNDFTKNNTAFDGWSLEPDGEVVYEDCATMTNVGAVQNGVIHLYAVWKRIVLNYAVRFDSHGGEGVMPNQTFEIGVQQNLSSCQFTRAGFVFGGWTLTTDGTVVFSDGETVIDLTTVQNSTVVLYAVWERDPAQEWTIEEYLNCTNITFALGGDSPHWYGEKTARDQQKGMMRSGAIGDSQTNWIETVVSGPGTISFWWKASGEFWQGKKIVELCDYAEFTVDGVSIAEIGAESSWVVVTQMVERAGSHTLRWMYHKDESGSGGEDCAWVSEVIWTPSASFDPIPDLGQVPSAADVAAVVADAVDAKVEANIDETNYNDFREWAGKVKAVGGSDAAGTAGVMASETAWLSYALGQGALLNAAPTDEDLSVETFTPLTESGKFDFTVSVKDIEVGSEAAKENLKKVFGLEGAAMLGDAAFSSDKVDVEFGTPVDGKVKFTAGPKDTDAKTFFMKVKLNP